MRTRYIKARGIQSRKMSSSEEDYDALDSIFKKKKPVSPPKKTSSIKNTERPKSTLQKFASSVKLLVDL